MLRVLKATAFCFFALAFSVGFMSADVVAATGAEAKASIEAAKSYRAKAASVDGEWRDLGKILGQAEQALKNGDYKQSVKLAEKATEQGRLGYEQMVRQRGKVGNPPYLNQFH